jgi:hypothetical protein
MRGRLSEKPALLRKKFLDPEPVGVMSKTHGAKMEPPG